MTQANFCKAFCVRNRISVTNEKHLNITQPAILRFLQRFSRFTRLIVFCTRSMINEYGYAQVVWLHQWFQRKQLKGSPTQATWRHVDFPADDHARELGLRPITTQSFGNISSELRVHINLWRKTLQDTNHFKVLKRGIPDSIQQTYSEICALL